MPFCAKRSKQLTASLRWPWEQRYRKFWTMQGFLWLWGLNGDLRMRVGEEKDGIAGGQHVG